MSAVYVEIIAVCMECGHTELYFGRHPKAQKKSDINEYTDEESYVSSSLHPCGRKLGGRMRRTARAVEPPVGCVAVGCEVSA